MHQYYENRKRVIMEKTKKDFTPKNYFIAYIDILGYETHLKSKGTSGFAQGLHEIIMAVKNFPDFPEISPEEQRKFKVFSDNIIVCSETSWENVLVHAQYIQQYLLAAGIFSRGSLLYGELYFDENFICGQGIIYANKLESEIAIFPRIIVDESFMEAMEPLIIDYYLKSSQEAQPYSKQDIDEPKIKDNWRENFFKKDFDGMFFLDYLSLFSTPEPASKKEILKNIKYHRDVVRQNLISNANNKRILQKFQWCQNYHNEFCLKNGYSDLIIRDE